MTSPDNPTKTNEGSSGQSKQWDLAGRENDRHWVQLADDALGTPTRIIFRKGHSLNVSSDSLPHIIYGLTGKGNPQDLM